MATLAELELRIKSLEAVKATKNLKGLETVSKKVATGSKTATKAFEKQNKATQKLSKSTNQMVTSLKGLVAGVTGLLILRQVVTVFAEFEQTMAEVQGVTRATEAQFASLTEQARQLGAVTRFSSRQAAEAQLALSRAGFTVIETLKTSRAVLDLAAGAQLELGRSAEITAITIRQFALAATDAVEVTDILVNTANSATTNVEGLAQALKFTGSIASSFGKDLAETAAAIGVVADAGLDASQAGTGLRGVFSKLGDPIGKAGATLDKLAKRLGETRKLFDITENSLADIFQAFKDAGASTQDFIRIFGRLQAPAALALVANVEKIRELTEANKAAGGTAAELARVMNDTLKGSMLALKSATEELFLSMGDSFLGAVFRSLVDLARDTVLALSNFEDGTTKLSTASRILAFAIKLLTASLVAYGARLVAIQLAAVGAKFATLGFVAALRTVKVALASTGIGLVLVLVSELVVAFSNLGDSTDKSARKIRELEAAQRKSIEATREEIRALEELDKKRIQGIGNLQTLVDRFNAALKLQGQLQRGLSTDQIKALNDEQALTEFALQAARDRLGVDKLNVVQRARVLVGVKNVLAAEKDALILSERAKNVGKDRNKTLEDQLKIQKDLAKFRTAQVIAVEETGLTAAQVRVERLEKEFEELFLVAKNAKDVMDLSDLDFDEFSRGLDLISEQQREIASNRALEKVFKEGAAAARTFEAALKSTETELALLRAAGEDQTLVRTQIEFADAVEATLTALEAQDASPDELIAGLVEVNDIISEIATNDGLVKLINDGRDAAMAMEEMKVSLSDTVDPLDEFIRLSETALAGYKAELGKTVGAQEAFNLRQQEMNAQIQNFKTNLEQLEVIDRLNQVAEGLAESFGNFFETIITGSQTAGEAALDLVKEISRLALRKLAIEPLVNALKAGIGAAIGAGGGGSFFGSAKGNAFHHGQLQAFAQGGIIGGPSVFPLGLAGEKGPEAILPLKRDSAGNLGVAQVDSRPQRRVTLTRPFVNASVSTGASEAPSRQEMQRGGTRIINQQLNVQSLDPNAFRQSSSQIQADAMRAARFQRF